MRGNHGARHRSRLCASGQRREWQGFLWSYWGLFGGLNVALEAWTYAVFNLLAIAALLGLVCFAWRCLRRSCRVNGIRLFILVVWPVTVFVALIRWTLMTPASQGRLLFSAIAAISTLLALGLVQWIPAGGRRIGAGVLAGALCVIAAVVPFRIIAPAYAPPPLLDSAASAAVPERLDVTFDSGIKLVGYQLAADEVQTVATGLPVTLYWEATVPIDRITASSYPCWRKMTWSSPSGTPTPGGAACRQAHGPLAKSSPTRSCCRSPEQPTRPARHRSSSVCTTLVRGNGFLLCPLRDGISAITCVSATLRYSPPGTAPSRIRSISASRDG